MGFPTYIFRLLTPTLIASGSIVVIGLSESNLQLNMIINMSIKCKVTHIHLSSTVQVYHKNLKNFTAVNFKV